MVSIPASLIATFIGISLFGYTLNLMSLLGLSLVVGILVDDAIVVLENIYRHMEMGKNHVRAASDATREIGFTVVSITFVIVVVFFPIAVSTRLGIQYSPSVLCGGNYRHIAFACSPHLPSFHCCPHALVNWKKLKAKMFSDVLSFGLKNN